MDMEKLTMREILSGHKNPSGRIKDSAVLTEYPHLMFSNIEHYQQALEQAKQYGEKALKTFNGSFAFLERVCTNRNMTVEVFPDHIPYSFYFQFYNADSSRETNGGIILHGVPGNSFSVQLNPSAAPEWSVHS